MHGKLSAVYKPCCNHVAHLAAGDDFTIPKELEDAFNRAVKFLHNKQSFKADDLRNKEIKPLISGINDVLQEALQTGLKTEIPAKMLEALQQDVFIFSGLKTYAQLKEASLLLLDEKGQIKSWPQFRNDVLSIHKSYNENYLRAEHQHAIGTAEAIGKWHDWEKDGDKYDLQIRTAGDEKVRGSHAVLDRITLPFSDPFWRTHMIPFDWGCRCNIIQVLKGKYTVTDSTAAINLGNKAVPEMFRYNPAIDGVVFPPKHPYYKLSKEAVNIMNDEADKALKTINISNIIKGNKVTDEDVNNVIQEYAKSFPDNFSNGFNRVEIISQKGVFMQHNNASLQGQWVGGATIKISSYPTKINGVAFNPSKEFKNALLNIKNNKPLSFNEENAVQAFWHEVLHAKSKTAPVTLYSDERQYMETLNEFCARHTYNTFIESLGGRAVHQKEIISKGIGYNDWVSEFRTRIKQKGISEEKALADLMPDLMDDYKKIKIAVENYIK